MKYTELRLILSLMYVKKIYQFLLSIKKRCTRKKIGSFSQPHGIYWCTTVVS